MKVAQPAPEQSKFWNFFKNLIIIVIALVLFSLVFDTVLSFGLKTIFGPDTTK
jgi:hypothetical protein